MFKKRKLESILVYTIIFIIFVISIISYTSLARTNEIEIPDAHIIINNGDVYIKHDGDADWQLAENGMVLVENDSIKTGLVSQADLYFFDNSTIRLDSESEIKLSELYIDQANPLLSNINVELKSGHFWARIINLLDLDSSFTITAEDTVATVRGTAIDATVNKGSQKQLTLNVDEGYVNLANSRLPDPIALFAQETVICNLNIGKKPPTLKNKNIIYKATNRADLIKNAGISLQPLNTNIANSEWFKNNRQNDKKYIQEIEDKKLKEITDKAGILPDSLLYKVKLIAEKISLTITFSEEKKIKKKFDYANRRAYEAEALIINNKTALGIKKLEEANLMLYQLKNELPEEQKKYISYYENEILEHQILLQTILPNDELYEAKKVLNDLYIHIPENDTERIKRILNSQQLRQKEIKDMLLQDDLTNFDESVKALQARGEINAENFEHIIRQLPIENDLLIQKLKELNITTPENIDQIIQEKEAFKQAFLLNTNIKDTATNADGSQIIEFADGTIKEILPDGRIKLTLQKLPDPNISTDNQAKESEPGTIEKIFNSEFEVTEFIRNQRIGSNISSLPNQDEENSDENSEENQEETNEDNNPEEIKKIINEFINLIGNDNLLNFYIKQNYDDLPTLAKSLEELNSITEIKIRIDYLKQKAKETTKIEDSTKNILITKIMIDLELAPGINIYLQEQSTSLSQIREELLQTNSEEEILAKKQTIFESLKKITLDQTEDNREKLIKSLTLDFESIPAISNYIKASYGGLPETIEHLKSQSTYEDAQRFLDNIRQQSMIEIIKQQRIDKFQNETINQPLFREYMQSRNMTLEMVLSNIKNYNDIESVDTFITKLVSDYQKFIIENDPDSNSVEPEPTDEVPIANLESNREEPISGSQEPVEPEPIEPTEPEPTEPEPTVIDPNTIYFEE